MRQWMDQAEDEEATGKKMQELHSLSIGRENIERNK